MCLFSKGNAESKLNDVNDRERLREKKMNDKKKQSEKDIINITNETTKSEAEDIPKEKYLEEQTKTRDPHEVTTEKQHLKAGNKGEQREPILNIPAQMTDEESMIKEVCRKATDIRKKTKACPEAKNSEDDTDNVSQCKAKENLCLKSESTEDRESIKTTPNNQEIEHLYEVPDDILTRSAEYINETERVKEQLKHLDNVTLHIAVTGSTGAGKSSFINAMRGLQPDDVKAAPTGVIETTMTPTMYTHPTMPNVKLWDLPGTGSPKFKAKKYLKEVKLETFDFFIIISSERFKENDIMLAEAIKERKKLFYFLRSKVDNDIHAESQRKDFDEQKVLSHIREDCHRNLKDNPHVFLISSFELHKYDFQTLVDTLEKHLPDHKRDALVLSLPIYSSKILEKKIETFKKQTLSAAVASGSIAVVPVPGLSIACDAAIMLGFFTKCYYAFGLDDESIDKLSVRVNNPSLKSVRSSPLVVAIGQKKLSNKELSALASKDSAVKYAWSMVPVVGSRRTAEMSYSATLKLLRAGLQDLADTAREVLKAAGLTDAY